MTAPLAKRPGTRYGLLDGWKMIDQEQGRRSRVMRAVTSADTRLELMVRRYIHRLGYRYRLHRKDLPGTPDLVFAARRKVIFVHGCFWHQHSCRQGNRLPKSRQDYWVPKLRRNVERDAADQRLLQESGWNVMVIWECETKKGCVDALEAKIRSFLDNGTG